MEEKRAKILRKSLSWITEVKKIIVDTSILIDYVNGYASWVENIIVAEKKTTQLVLPTIVIAEYFTSTVLEDEKEVKITNETFSLFGRQDLNEDIAKILGAILRRKSYTPGTGLADLIIAATAIFFDVPLATRNRKDFAKIPNLRFFEAEQFNKRVH